ncbi:hypothetical protein DIPPA_09170 [Diplonema papillatum]|nr:hypothetical protein DIPPA_09170 [Diplonema papillatum]
MEMWKRPQEAEATAAACEPGAHVKGGQPKRSREDEQAKARYIGESGKRPKLCMMTQRCASSTACKLAHKALQVLAGASAGSLKKGIGAGMSKGKMLVGNSGDKTVRAFNFMGPAVNIAWKLSDIATSFCQPADFELLLDGPFHKDVEIEVESFSVGSLKMDEKFPWLATSHRLRMLYLVMQMKEADAEAEWMYQVEQLQGEEGVSLQSVMDLIFHADLDLKVYEVNCPLLVDLLTAAKKPVLIEKLTKSYVDFCVNVRNKL